MALEQDLLDIEKQIWNGGAEAYERHMDDQCLVSFREVAGVMSKAEIIKQAEQARWQNVEIEPKGITELSDDAAVVAYRCNATRSDGRPYVALVSSAYAKRYGEWKLAFHQQTPLDSPVEQATSQAN
jgi:hypothetical protein